MEPREQPDSVLHDLLDRQTALAIEQAIPGTMKPLMRAANVGSSSTSRWSKDGGPFGRVSRILWRLSGMNRTRAHAIVAHYRALLAHRWMSLPTEEVAERYWSAVFSIIGGYTAMKLANFSLFWPDTNAAAEQGSLEDVERAALQLAAAAEELAACAREAQRRGISAQQWRETARKGNRNARRSS